VSASALILALLFVFLPMGELWAAMRRVPATVWLLILAGYLSTHLIGILKWRLMVNSAGAGLPVLEAGRCYLGGLCGAVFLPSIVGGDVIRVGLALRRAHNRAGVLLGSLLDRLLDIAALVGVAGAGALLLPGVLEPRVHRIFWFVGALVASAGLAVLALVALLSRRWLSRKLHRRFAHLRRAAKILSRQPQRVLLALALGLTAQTSLVVLSAWIAAVCGLHLAFPVWLFAWPLAKVSGLLPVTQGGIGVREVALSVLLVPFGARPTLAVAVGLVWETIVVTGGLVGGLLSFLFGRWSAAKAEPAQRGLAQAEEQVGRAALVND